MTEIKSAEISAILRKQYTHFRRTDFEDIIFYDLNNTVGLGYGFNLGTADHGVDQDET